MQRLEFKVKAAPASTECKSAAVGTLVRHYPLPAAALHTPVQPGAFVGGKNDGWVVVMTTRLRSRAQPASHVALIESARPRTAQRATARHTELVVCKPQSLANADHLARPAYEAVSGSCGQLRCKARLAGRRHNGGPSGV